MAQRFPFAGRARELAALEGERSHGNAFVVLYGRRRVGKTTLIKHFIEDKPALYFLASKEDDSLNRKRFAQDAASFTGNSLLANASFDDWRALFRTIADTLRDKPYLLVIDEFPYLMSSNKAMPSILQYVWDEILAGTGATLILCGSSVSMMRDEVLSHESPLYGRRTLQMRLKPLSFDETAELYPSASFESLVELYTLTGGVPKYLEFFDPAHEDTLSSIKRNILSTMGFLYEEPEFLLSEETRGTSTNLSLLRAIALGNRKIGEMATFLRRKATGLSPYLALLVSLGFLERRTPFTEKYPDRSKSGLYHVADAFMLFWLTYVQPFQAELEMGNMRPSLDALERSFGSSLVPHEFEVISAQAFARLCTNGAIDFSPRRIGGYWNRSGSLELDVCAQDSSQRKLFLGECKYYEHKPVGMNEYQRLLEKAPLVPGASESEVMFGLFSHTGFSEELLACARADKNLVLIDKNKLVEA